MNFRSSAQDTSNGFDLAFIKDSCHSLELDSGWHAPTRVQTMTDSEPNSFVILFFPSTDVNSIAKVQQPGPVVVLFLCFASETDIFLILFLAAPGGSNALLQRALKPSVDTAKKHLLPSPPQLFRLPVERCGLIQLETTSAPQHH